MLEREDNKHSFIIYRLPGDSTLHYGRIISDLEINNNTQGFAFSAFMSSRLNGFNLSNESSFNSLAELLKILPPITLTNCCEKSTDFSHYVKSFNTIKDKIEAKSLAKVVLSKKTFTKSINANTLLNLFKDYLGRFKNAFVSMVYIDGEYAWCGASPELFLNRNNELSSTIALASTRKSDGSGVAPKWNNKEVEEQWYVEKFVEDNLLRLGLAYTKTTAKAVQSGNLWHLKTDYAFSSEFKLSRYVSTMHPTPAVGGTPKTEALTLINQIEEHDRKYYAGIIGPVSENKTSLYVNIRCAEVFNNGAYIYSGGGITAGSDLNSEWEEANMKANSLMLP